MSKLHLVYAADANYLFPSEVSIRSAYHCASRPQDLVIHLLDCAIPADTWARWERHLREALPTLTLIRHEIDMGRFEGLRIYKGSSAAYARLSLPELLPTIDWCVYADGDTLFTDDPFKLEALFDDTVALLGHPCPRTQTTADAWFVREGVPMDWSRYVCSGFLAMNLNWMRAHDVTRRGLAFLRKHPNSPTHDEGALNVLCAGWVRFLPFEWGVFSGEVFGLGATRPGCIHYLCDLPCNLRFSLFFGYSDAQLIWISFVRAVMGLSRAEASRIPPCKWLFGRLYARMIALAVPLLALLPPIRRRFPNLRARFATRRTRHLLSPHFWTQGLRP